MSKEHVEIKKETVTKKKFTERMKIIGGWIKDKSVKTISWVVDHAAIIWGALFTGLVIFCKGFSKGHEEGRITERRNLERRKDVAFQLAMRNAGVTGDDLDTITETMDLIEDFGGPDEVRCLFDDQFDKW